MFDQFFSLLSAVYDVQGIIVWGGYAGITAVIFAETGLFIGFFLPGDSLLVTAGLLASTGLLDIFLLNALLIPAAILGDSLGYAIGKRFGPGLYARRDSFFFRRSHLQKAREFYARHGGKTIVLARFVPVVRTFAPVVAGAAGMPYRQFLFFNVLGGALWAGGLTSLGFFLGRVVPDLEKNLLLVIACVVFVSFLPALWELAASRRK